MPPVQINLAKGSDVYATVELPRNARGADALCLMCDGADVSKEYQPRSTGEARPLYSGVPKGRYQLRVLSTQEFMLKHGIEEWKAPKADGQTDMREGVDCEGLTVDFTIDDSTPALLELGTHQNRPTPVMRHKVAPTTIIGARAPTSSGSE